MKMRAKNMPITQIEFQRRAGLSPSRFRQLKAEGLPLVGKRVNYEKAVTWMQANVDPARQDNWQSSSLNDLRREREQMKIEQQKLELSKARGELLERKAVQKVSCRKGAHGARQLARVGLCPSRLGSPPRPALITATCSQAIEDEVRAQLRYLSEKPLEVEDDANDARLA